jgi:Anti-sigma factor NepR
LQEMATVPKNPPGRQLGFGAAQAAPGVGISVSKDEKDAHVKSNTAQSQEVRAGSKSRRAPAVLDRWFDAQLGRLYSDVATEPVPVEMLQLISKLKKPKQPGS